MLSNFSLIDGAAVVIPLSSPAGVFGSIVKSVVLGTAVGGSVIAGVMAPAATFSAMTSGRPKSCGIQSTRAYQNSSSEALTFKNSDIIKQTAISGM